jgi:hypothetical protein
MTTDPPPGPDPARDVAEHLAFRADFDAAFVMQDGRTDPIVEQLLAQGWTVENTEVVGGKHVRYLAAPPETKEPTA